MEEKVYRKMNATLETAIRPREEKNYHPNANAILGKFQLIVFFGTWVGSAGFVLIAIFHWYINGWKHAHLLALLLCYYSYRLFVSRERWNLCQSLAYYLAESHPYFRYQQTIFKGSKAIEPDSKALLSFHPHGILCCGWTLTGASNPELGKSEFHWLVADILFKLPFISDLMAWCACRPSGKTEMLSLMKQGKNIALLPGGFEEATIFSRGKHRIYLNKRKGFIKYALEYGYKIYPTYCFGEEETYSVLEKWMPLRLRLNEFKIPAVLFLGQWLCFFLPKSSSGITTIIDDPLDSPHIPKPTREDIEKYHKLYVKAIQKLFDTHKKDFCNDPTAELEIY